MSFMDCAYLRHMATIFGHGVLGYTLGKGILPDNSRALLITGIIFTMLPDADVIGFLNGVDYDSPWGHRGFTHSIFFAFLFSLAAMTIFKKQGWKAFIFLFLCMASHGLLDAMTSGGRGVAFFWPFENERYFLPWRPVKVSPIGASRFFTDRAWAVLRSEALVIGLPCVLALGLLRARTWKSSKHKPA